MKLLENDQNILQREKLYDLMDKLDSKLKITEESEKILLEFINEYTENLMETALNLESISKMTTDGNKSQGNKQEKFSETHLLETAKELLDRRGLSHNNIRKV